jgi:hypothetical protein
MAEHAIGTREEWQAARDELAKLEAEHSERNEEIKPGSWGAKAADQLVAGYGGWHGPWIAQ